MNKNCFILLKKNMDFKILFLLLFFFFLNEVNNSDLTENYFSFKLVDENMKLAYSIIPTISEDGYLYIVTGSFNLESNLSQRYIITYDINSATLIKEYRYNTSFAFGHGEAYAFIGKSQYLFINTNSRFGVRDIIGGEEKIWEDSSICGTERFFKKVGYFYYFAHLDCHNNENNYLFIKKMEIDYYKDNIPHFEITKANNELKVAKNLDISCDLTKDNNYIICAYYTENYNTYNISISAFNKELELLLTETLGETTSKRNNYITIYCFKENSNFIMMNSQNSDIARLSYFSYSNNQIIDKLSSITQNSQHYVDIENTQYNGFRNNNEIITVDDKIIKIFTRRGDINKQSKQIIITIIQFYENDTSMSIKIYNMFNNNEFSSFFYPRISMLKQSFVFCSSAVNNNIRKTGYFFINYPNSTDINLDKSNIIIKDLIKLENKLFSINLKFKVLSIPDDFRLISKSNSLEINNNDELELNDELILRQYKINEGPFILKYQAIARGTDLGYSHLKVYPPEKVLINKELLFEGRHGNIMIDFKNCLDGYYNFENSENLCSNVRPKGYYLDKDNKIFRACPLTCEDCDAPDNTHTNCLSCKENYYMTEDTEACCEKGEDKYYFDENNNKLRRCHQNCLKCYGRPIDETNMNCYKCPDNFYMTENTKSCYDYIPNHYYLDDKILRHCYKRCNNCLGTKNNETMNCLGCISDEYYYKNDTNDCIIPEEFKKRNDLEFKKINNDNLFIFIAIFISALIIFIITCKFYKIKEQKKQQNNKEEQENKEQQEQQKKGLLDKKNDEKIYEMEDK